MLRAITALLVLQSLSYGAGVFESSPEYEAATAIAEKTEIDTSSAAKAQPKKRVGPIEVRAARSEFMQLWTRLSADLNYTSLEQSDFVSPEILTSNHLFAGQVRSLFEGLKKLNLLTKSVVCKK